MSTDVVVTAIDPSALAASIANSLADSMGGVLTTTAPIVAGLLAAFWAFRFVQRKITGASNGSGSK
jgi:hypothetical protein